MFEVKNTDQLDAAAIIQTATYLGDRLGRLGVIVTHNPASEATRRKVSPTPSSSVAARLASAWRWERDPSQIVAYVARFNSRALLIGLTLGLAASLGVSKVLESSLFGASRLDPLAYGGVLLVLFMAGVAASIVPARRAAGIAPLEALHYE